MDPDFWHTRWESGEVHFHQAEVNPALVQHWPGLGLSAGEAVFVPLCGKSLDLHWLRQRGHPVIGVELSPIALRDFFAEAELKGERAQRGAFEVFRGAGFELYAGDFFDLTAAELASVRGVYDRAALIALPPDLRVRYAEQMAAILPPGVSILLVTLAYDPAKMDGPPHSVPPAEIERLFGDHFEVETLGSDDEAPVPPRFSERGLDRWCETVMRLRRG